jgi:hypothetical protein
MTALSGFWESSSTHLQSFVKIQISLNGDVGTIELVPSKSNLRIGKLGMNASFATYRGTLSRFCQCMPLSNNFFVHRFFV